MPLSATHVSDRHYQDGSDFKSSAG